MAEIMSSQPPAKPTANCSGFGSRKCNVILADSCANASVPTTLRMMLPTTTGRRPTPDAFGRATPRPDVRSGMMVGGTFPAAMRLKSDVIFSASESSALNQACIDL